MRILFVTSAMASHFFPMAPFAWAAQAAGHEVRVATQPGLAAVVARSGLPTVAVGADVDFAARYRGKAGPGGSGDPKLLFCAVAGTMLDDLVALARHWRPELVVWEPTSFAGPVVAAAVGVPSVRYLWGPDVVGRGGSGRDRMPAEAHELFARVGARLDDVPEWTTVDPCPPSIQLPTSGPWRHVRYVPYSTASRIPPSLLGAGRPSWEPLGSARLSSELLGSARPSPALLGAARPSPALRPRVLVTLGMSVTDLVGPRAFLPPLIVRALAGQDVESLVVLSAGQAAALSDAGPLPDNVRVVTDCPLSALVAGSDVVVHHGGAGTMLTAADAGVPQLVLAPMPDLAFYGDRVAATGAGIRLSAEGVTEAAVRDSVTALRTAPHHRAAAQRLREEALRQPTPAHLVHELTELTTAPRERQEALS